MTKLSQQLQTVIERIDPRDSYIERARRNLYYYCKAKFPKVYDKEKEYLKVICDTLQLFFEDKLFKANGEPYDKLMLNLPPRHYKTFTLGHAIEWYIGTYKNPVINLSYNETLSNRFSKNIRDSIATENKDYNSIMFQDVFPDCQLKHGDKASQMWAIKGMHLTYLGASLKSTITGMGCLLGVVDDPVKNSEEALNEPLLERLFFEYSNTFVSRVEEGGKQIFNMTRWADNDPCGKLLEKQKGDWYQLQMPAYNIENDTMLCDSVLSYKSYIEKTSLMDDSIASANYQQLPLDNKNRMYKSFMTYERAPTGKVWSYTDTADEGKDYLAKFVFVEHNNQAYIIDVLYTKDPMEITEGMSSEMNESNGVDEDVIESNNGGKGFARNVKKGLKTNRCDVKWFFQSKNKKSRIYSKSNWCQKNIYWPVGWAERWPQLSKDIMSYVREGKNLHDDSPDAYTGISEIILQEITNLTSVNDTEFQDWAI